MGGDGVLTQRRRDAEYAEGMNRVEHVDHVEDLEMGLSHKVHKEQKDGIWEMGFHPIPRMRANQL